MQKRKNLKKFTFSQALKRAEDPLQQKQFQQTLFAWFRKTARDLPWRHTRDPYHILVSEIMLQQTQVDRVIPKYLAFLEAFPTIESLARAPQHKVVRHWQGLGYNRRALYLQKAAQTVMSKYDGEFPRTIEGLQTLPGVGPYTAGAVASFAFNENTPIVDTNVERVVGRIFVGFEHLAQLSQAQFWKLTAPLLPGKRSIWKFNQSLMDFGAITCTSRAPKCGQCPFQQICASYPQIQNATAAQLRYKQKTQEKLYYGQPRRIWRGRILKFLHDQPKEQASIVQIGHAIQKDFSAERLPWLKSVIKSLEKDGFLLQQGDIIAINTKHEA